MSIDEKWSPFFKPEARSSGSELFRKGAVILSRMSDTEVQFFIKGSSPLKILFTSETIASPIFFASCTCPIFNKGQLCKHIWASLSLLDEKQADFLSEKTEIEKKEVAKKKSDLKEKQNEYRQQQYQKQKERLKAQKLEKQGRTPVEISVPRPIAEAMKYFLQNGFPMENPPDEDQLKTAKKKLARIFHPDLGGSHNEIVELNENFEILQRFVRDQT